MPRIDLNADVGEGFPDDEALIPWVTSVNIAAGGHAGDDATIARAIELAAQAGAAIGAHPGYPDREGFGRRVLSLAPGDLEATLVEQIRRVSDAAAAAGSELRHVKPHGALYHVAARDPAVAEIVARAIRQVSDDLVLVGLAASPSLEAGRAAGLRVATEAFADRRYEPDGRLRDRRHDDALIADPFEAAAQAVAIATDGVVVAWDGTAIRIAADSICVHGDQPGAAGRARAVRRALATAGVEVRPPDR